VHAPQPLLVNRPLAEVEYAAVVLRNAGIAYDIV
jgi:hypothetical protein